MTTTTEPQANGTTALANREFTDQQIRTRLDTAVGAGFGLEKASKEQLNAIYLLARHYDVDPLSDITLFQGRPFFTIDGRVRMMRRHPEYAGYRTRPLTQAEKEAWGYEPQEIVVECTIRTRRWGEIVARGKVSPNEFTRQPVARSHPQEMAEKRAIARASRMAFGVDVPDEDEVGRIIEVTPAETAANARRYDEVYGHEDDLAREGLVPPQIGARVVDTSTGEVLEEQRPMAGSPSRAELFTENRRLVQECERRGLTGVPVLPNRSGEDAIAAANADLRARLEEYAREHGDGPPPERQSPVEVC